MRQKLSIKKPPLDIIPLANNLSQIPLPIRILPGQLINKLIINKKQIEHTVMPHNILATIPHFLKQEGKAQYGLLDHLLIVGFLGGGRQGHVQQHCRHCGYCG